VKPEPNPTFLAKRSLIRTGTARAAEKSSFLSREKASEIAAKYLDNLSKKPENE
jgi:hypothetical protein